MTIECLLHTRLTFLFFQSSSPSIANSNYRITFDATGRIASVTNLISGVTSNVSHICEQKELINLIRLCLQVKQTFARFNSSVGTDKDNQVCFIDSTLYVSI